MLIPPSPAHPFLLLLKDYERDEEGLEEVHKTSAFVSSVE
jgi:hypothetical protein